MQPSKNTWGIVLAGGDGRRLHALSMDDRGTVIPKQFCSFRGGDSLFRTTVERLSGHVDRRRIVVVVAAAHRRWWQREVEDLAPENVIVQPCGRGTACGVLLPLIHIGYRDPDARIIVIPSDHYIEDEETYSWALMEATAHAKARPELLVLLGMEPEAPTSDYGWITPSEKPDGELRVVRAFVEKPDSTSAQALMESGALWSSFTFVTSADTLLDQFKRTLPWLVERFSVALAVESWKRRHEVLPRLYDKLPTVDFSSQVLQESDQTVHVLPVPPCGWTDLGTPERVAECLARARDCPAIDAEPARKPWPAVDLANRIETFADGHGATLLTGTEPPGGVKRSQDTV